MADNDGKVVSLRSVKQALESMRPHLQEQMDNLGGIVLKNYKYYENVLNTFREEPEPYKQLYDMIKDVININVEYLPGSLGQRLTGCLTPPGVSPALLSCMPNCIGALAPYGADICTFLVYKESKEEGVGSLELIHTPVSLGDKRADLSKAVVVLQTHDTLTPAEVKMLKSRGITHVRRMKVSPTEIRSTPFQPIDGAKTVIPVASGGSEKDGDGSGSNGMGWLWLFILLAVVVGVYFWMKNKQKTDNAT